jgi:hypothetical protein
MPKVTDSIVLSIPTGTTGTITGPDLVNDKGARGAHVVVRITGNAGRARKDRASQSYFTILASAALTAVATTLYRVFPMATPAANLVAKRRPAGRIEAADHRER